MTTIVDKVRDHIPCGILKLFGAEPERCRVVDRSAIRTTKEQYNAYAFYDNLAGASPDKEISFRQYEKVDGRLTGRSRQRTITVAQLINLSGDWRSHYTRMGDILSRNTDLFTTVRPSDNDRMAMLTRDANLGGYNQTRDPAIADPTDILRAPWPSRAGHIADPYHPRDPRSVAPWYPNIANIPVMYPTPKLLNQRDVSNDRLRTLYFDVVRAVHAHLKARNVPSVFHPLCVATQAHIFPSRNAYSNADNESGAAVIREWATNNGDPSYLVQNTVLGFRYPNGETEPVFQAHPSHWIWERSLASRFPITVGTGTTLTRGVWDDLDRKITYNLYTADALLELLRWFNALNALYVTGDASVDARAVTVDVYAANALYHGAQVQAYVQIGRPFGSAVLGYRDQIDREAAARKARSRGNLGVPGYQSSGDDEADIAMGIVGCVGNAISAAVETGNVMVGIAALVITGANLLYTFLNGPDTPRNPYDYPIRMLGGKSCAIPGVSVKNALELCPVYRVR